MKRVTNVSKVLGVLREGPATTGEVAAELGWHVHITAAHLGNLFLAGRITRVRFPTADKRVRYLYSIAEEHPGEECSRRSMEDAAWRSQ